MTRAGPRDSWAAALELAGSVVPEARADRFRRSHPSGGSKTTGLASCRSTNARASGGLAMIERPIPSVRRLERRCPESREQREQAENRKGERRPGTVRATGTGGRRERRSGTVRRPAADGQRAARLMGAVGDQTSREAPDRRTKRRGRAGRVISEQADLPAVPESADCFGSNGRSRARTPRRR